MQSKHINNIYNLQRSRLSIKQKLFHIKRQINHVLLPIFSLFFALHCTLPTLNNIFLWHIIGTRYYKHNNRTPQKMFYKSVYILVLFFSSSFFLFFSFLFFFLGEKNILAYYFHNFLNWNTYLLVIGHCPLINYKNGPSYWSIFNYTSHKCLIVNSR